jgi:hypothetical protein
MSDPLERKYAERSWALSVVLAKCPKEAFEEMGRRMDPDDVDRFVAIIDGYRDDIRIRELIGPYTVDEDPR